MKKAFFILAIYAGFFTACNKKNGLQLDLEKGQNANYLYNITQVNEAVNPQTGATITSTGTYNYTGSFTVLSEDDNGYLARVSFSDVNIRAVAKGLPQGMDTTMRMEMLNGKGADVFYSKTGQALRTEKQDTTGNVTQSVMMLMLEFSKELFIRFPEENKGQKTWTVERTDSMDQFGSKVFIKTKSEYTHVADIDTLGYSCAVVKYKMSASDFQVKNELAELMGFEMSMQGKGNASGTAYVDKETGLTVMNREELDYDMLMSSTAEGKTEEAPMKMHYSIYNVLKK